MNGCQERKKYAVVAAWTNSMAGLRPANLAMAEGVADYETERNACMGTTAFVDDDDDASPRLLHAFLLVLFIPTLHTNVNAQSPLNAPQFIARQHGQVRSIIIFHSL
jgi:hypothetical protein